MYQKIEAAAQRLEYSCKKNNMKTYSLWMNCGTYNMAAIFFCWQLRVVKAFKSTLEDLEEKRSVHSFHSLHSIRSSRSHQGPRPISEEAVYNNHDKTLRSISTPPYSSHSSDHPVELLFKKKSQSYEHVP